MVPIHVFIAHTHSTAQHEEKAQDCTGHSREAPFSFLYMCIKGLRAATKLWWTHWPSRVPFACQKLPQLPKKMKSREKNLYLFFWRVFMAITQCPAAVIKVENAFLRQCQSERETWQVLPAPSSNSRKAQHENCDQQQCFLFSSFSSTLYLPPPLHGRGTYWTCLCICLSTNFLCVFACVFAGLIVAHAAYAQRT